MKVSECPVCGGAIDSRQDAPYIHPCDGCGRRWLCDADGKPIEESPGVDPIGPFEPGHSASYPPGPRGR